MFFDYSILNELKRVPTDAPEDEKDKYDLDEEDETEEPEEEPTNYELDEEDAEEDTEDETNYDLDEEDTDEDITDEEDPEEDTTEDETVDEEPPEDDESGYDLDDETDEENPEDGTEDDMTDMEDDTGDAPEGDSRNNNELKDLENKILDISPIGLDIREKTLKQDYLKLYNNINTILDKIRLVPKTSVNISVIEFCNKKLYELKSICYDYLLYTYSDKTYIENQKNYITYVGIIANINNLLMQIQRKME